MAKKKPKKIKKATPEIEPVVETPKVDPEPADLDPYDYSDTLGDAGPKVAEPPTEEKIEEPESPKIIEISDDLLTSAIKAGMSVSEAKSFGTDELLTTALAAIARASSTTKPTKASAAVAETPVADFELNLDPDLYEEEVINAFK